MLNTLKTFDVNRLSLDEALVLEVFAEGLQGGYEAHSVAEPEWLTDRMKVLSKYIVSAIEDQLDAEIKMAEVMLTGLQTPGEKRVALQQKLAKLRKQRKTVA